MKSMTKNILYIALFSSLFMWMMPKDKLYYQLEHLVKREHIVIDGEEVSSKGFWLEVYRPSFYFRQTPIAEAEDANLFLFGLYNTVTMTNITLGEAAETLLPSTIEHAGITYSIFRPLTLFATAKGDFGTADIKIDLMERSLSIFAKPSKVMQMDYPNTLRRLTHQEEGVYSYETSF